MLAEMQGPALAALSCGKASILIVLLHGRGANADDMINMGLNWQPIIPKAEVVALNAPFPYPGSEKGREWFSLEDRSPAAIEAGLRASAKLLDEAISEMLAQRRVDESHLALVGFSQGATMALHVGLRRPKPPAALVAIAGSLKLPETLAGEITCRPQTLLIHGDADEVVPYACLAEAKAALAAQDVPVKSLTRKGIGHTVDDAAVMKMGEYLCANLIIKKKPAAHDDHDHDHDDHDHDDHDHEHDDHEDHDHDAHDHAH